ncbi:MAG: putative FAD-dependent dehydrogenase [Flavobacteriales bacterium]|jgi:uncharacterized FAD-dependent dehydrogenase
MQELRLRLQPEQAANTDEIKRIVARTLRANEDELGAIVIRKRSIDARKGVIVQLDLQVYTPGEEVVEEEFPTDYKDVSDAEVVHIIGFGPAGIFAALRLIELGMKPVIFERGKDVRSRRRDLALLNRDHIVNEDSNYCYGEGGAGTYSDGKLYTRSTKRGNVREVLNTFVAHGAEATIMVEAHPHIGTNKLPSIIVDMRETILKYGGEVNFDSRITDIIEEEGKLKALVVNEKEIPSSHVILATGHSARDIFTLFEKKKWHIEAKSFALGVRVEHPQQLIDQIQYKREERGEALPPAAYNLVCQIEDKGVYSFCMCPGGIIAPCATAPGEIVTNGWSPSKRNNPYANSGMVVTVEVEDLEAHGFSGPLGGLQFQQVIEQKACDMAGGSQKAPAQRLLDFVENRLSRDLPDCSYTPGLVSVNMHDLFPNFISKRLVEGFKDFDRKMRGFLTNDAVIVGPESRTSSPVRIPRDRETFVHPEVAGLYPCGEGAGYAGGIMSAAIDGRKIAESIFAIQSEKA